MLTSQHNNVFNTRYIMMHMVIHTWVFLQYIRIIDWYLRSPAVSLDGK